MSWFWECITICIKCQHETKKSRGESVTDVPPENDGQADLLGPGSRRPQIMNYESARSHSIRGTTTQQSPSHSVQPPNTPKPSPTPSRSNRFATSLRLSIHQAWPGSSRLSISGNSDIIDENRSTRSPASNTPRLLSQLIGTFRNTVEEFVNTVLRPSLNFDDLECSNAQACIVRNVVQLVGNPDNDAETFKELAGQLDVELFGQQFSKPTRTNSDLVNICGRGHEIHDVIIGSEQHYRFDWQGQSGSSGTRNKFPDLFRDEECIFEGE